MDKRLANRLDTYLTTQPENNTMLTKPLPTLHEGNYFRFYFDIHPKDLRAYNLYAALKELIDDLEDTEDHISEDGKPWRTHKLATEAIKEYEAIPDAVTVHHNVKPIWKIVSTNSTSVHIVGGESTIEHRYIFIDSLPPNMVVIIVGCEWCNKTDQYLAVDQVQDHGVIYQVCEFCLSDYHDSQAAEAASEQAAEQAAHMAFHFPGSHGPHAGPEPDDERERHLEADYWDESDKHPNYKPSDNK